MLNDLPDILTLAEASKLLRLSRSTILREINNRHIKYMRFGRQYRFLKEDLIDYMKKQASE